MSHLGERLTAFVDGELDHGERDRALAHLAVCEPCRAEADGLRQLKGRLRSLSEITPSAGMMNRLLAMGEPGSGIGAGEAAEASAAARSAGAATAGLGGTAGAGGAGGAGGTSTAGTGTGAGDPPAERLHPAGRPRRVARTGGSFGRPAAGSGAGANRPRRRSSARSSAAFFAAAPSLLPTSPALTGSLAGPRLPVLPADPATPGETAAPPAGTAGLPTVTGSPGGPLRRRPPLVRNLAMGAATFAIFGVGAAAYVTGSETAQAPRFAPALQRFSLEYALTSGNGPMRPAPAGSRTTQAVGPTTQSSP